MTCIEPKRVFSPRLENYIKYRPGYPREVLDTLRTECGLSPAWRVADIGSGTGLLARLFLDIGCTVFGVEPNQEMRLAGEQLLAGYSRFTSLTGSAELTGLISSSVDLVSAGMAFHWFDIPRARSEFLRILVPGGWVVLVWNRMLRGPDPFMQAYTDLVMEYSPGWTETQRRDEEGSSLDLPGFFNAVYHRVVFPNHQHMDWNGLLGRTLSIAHAPQPSEPAYQDMLPRMKKIYECFQSTGQVTLLYETELYFGQLT